MRKRPSRVPSQTRRWTPQAHRLASGRSEPARIVILIGETGYDDGEGSSQNGAAKATFGGVPHRQREQSDADLILLSAPDARFVGGIKKWNEQGRRVIKGRKGIKILVLVTRK